MSPIIAHQGVPGAYSHQAALKYFGKQASLTHYDSFAETLTAVSQAQADYAVFPVENNAAGMVEPNVELLTQYNLITHDELWLPIEHCLLALPDAHITQIDTVISHPQGLKQCHRFLSQQPWTQQAFPNTAAAAKAIADIPLPTAAAIASRHAAKYYGLDILAERIADNPQNQTRFLILMRPIT